MINSNIPTSSSISAIKAKVELYDGSTLVKTCTCSDYLQDFIVSREGDTSKFFGFGVAHKVATALIDTDRTLVVNPGNTLEIALGDGTIFDYPFPTLYIVEVEREEKSNNITCTAYDALYKASNHVISELNLVAPYTLRDLATQIATLIGLEVIGLDEAFDITYPEGANFTGDEAFRVILNAIAEVTQTIYYVNNENKLVFKRLDKDGDSVLTITKSMYYELSTQTDRTITGICNATELGDNVYSGDDSGIVQFVRNNPLWENRTDIGSLLDIALTRVTGLTITQLDCDWEGNHLLEIGDKISVVAEDNSLVNCFIIDDVIDYQGYINQITAWEFTQDEAATAANPTSIGDKINQTFARVDKINKEITLMASDVTETKSELAEIKLTTDTITLRVENLEQSEVDLETDSNFIALKERVGALEVSDNEINAKVSATEEIINATNANVETLTNEVNLKLSAEDVTIAITNTLNEGIDKVVTSTKKYTFDDEGLNIGSTDNSISTIISEDGMKIYKQSQEVLVADNQGVKAEDLHATTYLIIGENSRLEDWQSNYTACFWIGD